MSTPPISRRDLLKWAAAGAGAAAVGGITYAYGSAGSSGAPRSISSRTPDAARRPQVTAAAPATDLPTASAVADLGSRMLVVVELGGGNDGLSMMVPYGMGAYYDLRRTTAVAESEVLAIDDETGFHASLPKLHARGAAVIQGVGSLTPDGSHFEMMSRWWSGSPLAGSAYDTGFFGRLADVIGDPDAAAVAVSVGGSGSPAVVSRRVGTLSVPDLESTTSVVGAGDDDPIRQAFQRGFGGFGAGTGVGEIDARLRAAAAQSTRFAQTLAGTTPGDPESYPGSGLADGLRLAAQLLAQDAGVRIVHVPAHQDYDTHDDHNGRYPTLMTDLDDALQAFFDDIAARGLSDRVLVLTTSEFGRTVRDNDSGGLDHGTASHALLMGPVNAGRHGEHPSLTALDGDDNLRATVGLDAYYATVAEHWFGVPASEVLDGGATPISGIISGS